ncbi:17-beta-hydroxysteroid dehydrogenase type 2-like isoform X2 [Ranitomeya imitator]|uniref:17-beta-hydroxysteroid dehydrogenase type 2-like isoform X2 n=1 Tax=Ranitomeya imitator TaxID=111125 RepID=UPI0037E9144E
METVQCDSALSYVALSALFSGLVAHKLIRNKVKIENVSVSYLLSLLLLEILCSCVFCSHLGLPLFVAACALYYVSIPVRRMLTAQGKTVLITGCDSGLGHALAKYFDELGVLVYAGVLDKKGQGAEELRRVCSSRLSLIQLDVTNQGQIKTVYDEVKNRVQDAGLWGIVHNAGVLGYMADGELLPISVYKQCMDVNFIGVVEVTKMFMPLLRKAKGRLVTISSMADIFGSREHWSSQDQNILDNIMPDVKEDYGEDYLASLKDLRYTMSTIASPDLSPVLEDVSHALLAREPYFSYTPGQYAYLIPCLFRYFPLWVYDNFAKQSFQIHRNILPRSLRKSKSNNKMD